MIKYFRITTTSALIRQLPGHLFKEVLVRKDQTTMHWRQENTTDLSLDRYRDILEEVTIEKYLKDQDGSYDWYFTKVSEHFKKEFYKEVLSD